MQLDQLIKLREMYKDATPSPHTDVVLDSIDILILHHIDPKRSSSPEAEKTPIEKKIKLIYGREDEESVKIYLADKKNSNFDMDEMIEK